MKKKQKEIINTMNKQLLELITKFAKKNCPILTPGMKPEEFTSGCLLGRAQAARMLFQDLLDGEFIDEDTHEILTATLSYVDVDEIREYKKAVAEAAKEEEQNALETALAEQGDTNNE